MSPQDSGSLGKIMLVSSEPSTEVEKCLRSAGREFVTVNDGAAAIVQAQHATFRMAVLVSTGKAMDLAETVFNLRDISSSMPILIIRGRSADQDSEADIIAHSSPNTRTLTVHDLEAYLDISISSTRRSFGKRHHQYKI